MRYKPQLFIIVIIAVLLMPKANAQENQNILNRIRNAERAPFIQSARLCYKQNGLIYSPENGITTADCLFNTQLIHFELKGSAGVNTNNSAQQLVVPKELAASVGAQQTFNFYSMFATTKQREILAQKSFTTPSLEIPTLILKIAPYLKGRHNVTFNTWAEFLGNNPSKLRFIAKVN